MFWAAIDKLIHRRRPIPPAVAHRVHCETARKAATTRRTRQRDRVMAKMAELRVELGLDG